eukprot:68017-Prymnesium_polylepis.1
MWGGTRLWVSVHAARSEGACRRCLRCVRASGRGSSRLVSSGGQLMLRVRHVVALGGDAGGSGQGGAGGGLSCG